jgi:hypothetical protein
MPEKCARYGSDKMMEDVPLNSDVAQATGRSQGLVAYVQSDPKAWLLKGTVFGNLRGRVCGGCGYTEIYTTNFSKLYEAYRQSRGG